MHNTRSYPTTYSTPNISHRVAEMTQTLTPHTGQQKSNNKSRQKSPHAYYTSPTHVSYISRRTTHAAIQCHTAHPTYLTLCSDNAAWCTTLPFVHTITKQTQTHPRPHSAHMPCTAPDAQRKMPTIETQRIAIAQFSAELSRTQPTQNRPQPPPCVDTHQTPTRPHICVTPHTSLDAQRTGLSNDTRPVVGKNLPHELRFFSQQVVSQVGSGNVGVLTRTKHRHPLAHVLPPAHHWMHNEQSYPTTPHTLLAKIYHTSCFFSRNSMLCETCCGCLDAQNMGF